MKHKFFVCLFLLSILISNVKTIYALESPISLPITEGSKNFDFEISGLNRNGVSQYNNNLFKEARELFKKATLLAKQFKDPSLGVVSFNLGLSLHKLEVHEEAVKAFATAKKYARGNKTILNSQIVLNHECGFNPSIKCENSLPKNMHIEGFN